MDFSEITLRDKQLFDEYLKLYRPQESEFTFTNMFAWRKYYRFKYTILNNLLCIIALPSGLEPYALMPAGELDRPRTEESIRLLTGYFKENGLRPTFRKIAKEHLDYFKNHVKSSDDIVFDRDNSDYVYSTSDLIWLKGKKFDGKRNHINKFKSNYQFEYTPLDETLVDECNRIMEEWCRVKNCSCQDGQYCERLANLEILKHYNQLGCKGALISVNGKYEAFTVGEMLNPDTAVIHIEKANTTIQGLYPLINQQFVEREWSSTLFINREQDLGLEGMRKAKLSYNPVKMIDKYTVYTC